MVIQPEVLQQQLLAEQQAMAANGWWCWKKCMCPGYPEHRYKSTDNEFNKHVIYVWYTKNRFAHNGKFGQRLKVGSITTDLANYLQTL